MVGTLIGVILLLVVLGVVIWAIQSLLPLVPMPPEFRTVVSVLLTVVVVLIIVYAIAGMFGVVTPFRL
jgi:hypothetical protein